MSRAIETFVVIDFDRTLGDTDELLRALGDVLLRHPEVVGQAMLEQAATDSAHLGESFDSVTWVRQQIPGTAWQAIRQEFMAQDEDEANDFLLPGARELLEYLDQAHISYGILTYGGEEWQQMKLAKAKLADIPTIITADPAKGQELKRWQLPDGTYELPAAYVSDVGRVVVRHVIMLDDKLSSFTDAPTANSTMIQVRSGQDHDVRPAGVRQVKDLYEALDVIQSLMAR